MLSMKGKFRVDTSLHLSAIWRDHRIRYSFSDNNQLDQTEPGPRLNIKTVLSTYGDFHVKDKTAVRTSYL